ncbi:hypothetical protein CCL21_09360 [Pseudomonas syringae]|uniref:hypothetical protein n=1 Tax=Pseudomonas syringae TaxID=317 RepID=UPI000BB65A71|nr:hypothetical protein [Pseudomonas syringae]PBP71008.1 hypothetical protein CCL21_09360 [Pseudomonas syringae]
MTVDAISIPNSGIPNPKELTGRLLAAMSIVRVINVDDDHHANPRGSLETVIAAIYADTIDATVVARAILPDNSDDLDDDEVIALLRAEWDAIGEERQQELTIAARRGEETHETIDYQENSVLDDNNALMSLPTLIGEDFDFQRMSFSQWREKGKNLLLDGTPTLVLFDRSFVQEGQSDTAGEELVKSILKEQDLDHIYTGLLTHTAVNEASETALAEKIFSEIEGISRRLVVIAKNRLSSGSDFPEALRMVLYADELESFRKHAIKSLSLATEQAVKLLESVKPYALMATFESARREGAYETDNVIRMTGASARRSLETSLRNPDFITKTLSKLRNAAGVELYLEGNERPGDLPEITWDEKFDSKAHLAKLSIPLAIGDIFRVYDINGSGADRYYILLAQPCDLSVRTDGKRSNNLDSLILTLLKPAKADESGKYPLLKSNQQSIGFLEVENSVPWIVNFSQQIKVPCLALDASVVNAEGLSTIGKAAELPESLSTAWRERFKKMQKDSASIIKRYAALVKTISKDAAIKRDADDARKAIAALVADVGTSHSVGITVKLDIETETLSYGLERFARVTDSTANGLFSLMAYHQIRPAFENELFYEAE